LGVWGGQYQKIAMTRFDEHSHAFLKFYQNLRKDSFWIPPNTR
jgi:hypothetical protein